MVGNTVRTRGRSVRAGCSIHLPSAIAVEQKESSAPAKRAKRGSTAAASNSHSTSTRWGCHMREGFSDGGDLYGPPREPSSWWDGN